MVRRGGAKGCNRTRRASLYRSVAVPLDGTPESETAMEWGLAIASRSNASLHLLMMARDPAGVGSGRVRAGAVPSGYLEGVASRAAARSGLPVRGVVLGGEAGAEERLVAHVRGQGVDLLVTAPSVAGRGREPTAHLCERLSAPVLVVPERGLDGDRLRTMLVPLDGAKSAERILPFVVGLAKLLDGHVTLLTILAPSYVIGASRSRGATVDCRVGTKRRAAQDYLDEVAGTLRHQGQTVGTRMLVGARPARAIADFVVSEGVGLVAISRSGRSGRSVVVPELVRLLEGVPAAILTCGPLEPRVSPRPLPMEA